MKRGTIQHPKMHHLAELLNPDGEPDIARAVGTLTALWEFTSQYAPQGDVGKFTDRHIERACYWRGTPGTLVALLVASGWLDNEAAHRLVVHDWADHCEGIVHSLLARRHEFFASGEVPRTYDLSREYRAEAEQFYASHKKSPQVQPVSEACKCGPTETPLNSESVNHLRDVRDVVPQVQPVDKALKLNRALADTDTDTDTIALADTGASEESAKNEGQGESDGMDSQKTKRLPKSTKALLAMTVNRALRFFDEPPDMRDAWGKWLYRCWGEYVASGGEFSDVEDIVKRIENDTNPHTAQAKGNGVIHTPDHVLSKDTMSLLKGRHIHWKPWPVDSSATNATTAG